MQNQPQVFGAATNEAPVKQNREAAAGFINFSFPSEANSGYSKIGPGLAMLLSKNIESAIHSEYTAAVAAGKVEEFNVWLKDNLVVSYQSAQRTGGAKVATTLTPKSW